MITLAALVVHAPCSLRAQGKPGQGAKAAVEQGLDEATFLKRPELWPSRCTVTGAVRVDGKSLTGASCFILEVKDTNLHLLTSDGEVSVLVRLSDTDAFTQVAAAWSKWNADQRALDYATLTRRADLWPKTVRFATVQKFKGADDKIEVYPSDCDFDVGCFDGARLRLGHAELDPHLDFDVRFTDLMERSRAQLGEKPRTVGRVFEQLDGKLFDLATGKSGGINPKHPPKYTLLYFSAGWCGPCRQFSPKLVEFYKTNRQAGRAFEVVWVSRDHGSQEMAEYAKSEQFPWIAVRYDQLRSIPVVQAYARYGIPDLMVLDADGNVLSDSYRDHEYRGASAVLEDFKVLLAGKR
ncbi:MAG: thioredoxin-like domain-containing protein [Planctomycetota bacterium]